LVIPSVHAIREMSGILHFQWTVLFALKWNLVNHRHWNIHHDSARFGVIVLQHDDNPSVACVCCIV
jgi:hypothetical protein